jgi:transposase
MKQIYTEEFKLEAVTLALSSDEPYAVTARNLGVNYQTFGNWMRRTMADPKNVKDSKTSKPGYQELERQLKAAKKELGYRQQEIELLKKAAAYFASLQKQ